MAISILIPTCNAEPFLAETLASVSLQERLPDEVIIVDDGSRDRTKEIATAWAGCQKFAVRIVDNEIPHVRSAGPGPAGARTTGLRFAKSDMIALLDHDDHLLPGHLRQLEACLLKHPEVVFCFADATEFQEDSTFERSFLAGKAIEQIAYRIEDSGLRVLVEPMLRAMLPGSFIPTASNLWRRAAAVEAGGFDPRVGTCDDMVFFTILSRLGGVAYYPFPLARKRLHANNLSHVRHSLRLCTNALNAFEMLGSDERLKLTAAETVELNVRIEELRQEVLYHASRQGLRVYWRIKKRLGLHRILQPSAFLRAMLSHSLAEQDAVGSVNP